MELCDILLQRFAPVDDFEYGLIEELAAAYWRLRRAWALETEMLENAMQKQTARRQLARMDAAFGDLAAQPKLGLLHRYESRLHLMYQRALHSLLLLRQVAPATCDLQNEPKTPCHCNEFPPKPLRKPPQTRRKMPQISRIFPHPPPRRRTSNRPRTCSLEDSRIALAGLSPQMNLGRLVFAVPQKPLPEQLITARRIVQSERAFQVPRSFLQPIEREQHATQLQMRTCGIGMPFDRGAERFHRLLGTSLPIEEDAVIDARIFLRRGLASKPQRREKSRFGYPSISIETLSLPCGVILTCAQSGAASNTAIAKRNTATPY
jgi:hypothetical protein